MSSKPLESFLAARSLGARLDAFVRLVRWTREEGEGFARLKSLLEEIESTPELGERFRAAARPIFEEVEGVALFADVGIPSDRGLLAEIGDRLFERVLPRPRGNRDLAKLVRRTHKQPVAHDYRRAHRIGRHAGDPPALAAIRQIVRNQSPPTQHHDLVATAPPHMHGRGPPALE